MIPAGLCNWGLQSMLQCAFGMSLSMSHFIGLVVSVVEEFVPNIRKTLPGSCAAVWSLQPERGGTRRGAAGTVPVSWMGRRRAACGYYLQAGEQRASAKPCK